MSGRDRHYYCGCGARWPNDRWTHCCIHGMFCAYDTYARHLDGKGGCVNPWDLLPVMRKLVHRSDPSATKVWTYCRAGQNGYEQNDIEERAA